MQFQQPFDAMSIEPTSFAPPPPLADYHVRIVESEPKQTNDGSGGYLELTLEILDPGPFQGRKIADRLNLFSTKSQQAVEIAYRTLSAYCRVTGVFNVQDSRQLHNIPFIANIGPQKDDPRYARVYQQKDINGNLPGKPAAPAAPAPQAVQAAPAPAAAPAWQPPGAPAAAPQAWQPPAAAPAAPVWTPPGAPAPAAAPAPAWQPPGTPGAAPAAAPKPPWVA